MKTNKLIILAALPLLLASCGNDKANPKVVSSYDWKNQLTEKDTYTYKDGHVSEILNESHFGEEVSKFKTVYDYDGDKNVRVKGYRYNDETQAWDYELIESFGYDEKGNEVLRYCGLIKDGVECPSTLSISVYNDKNLKLHETGYMVYDVDFELDLISDYTYNDKNQLVEEKNRSIFAIFIDRYTYNDNGTLKEKIEYASYDEGEESLSPLNVTYYTYNESNLLVEEAVYVFDEENPSEITLKIKNVYEYDSKNRLVKDSYYHLPDEEQTPGADGLALDSYIVYEY